MSQQKVLLVGWDAADWKVIRPLMDAGQMPALRRLVEGGAMGDLTTLQPVLSPMLWTSIATGKRPFKHGIHGFTEPNPAAEGIRPVTTLSRKVKAIWNILGQCGLRSNVIGWWPSHPAEPINGVMVSNHYHQASVRPDKWEVPKDAIYPERLRDELIDLRIHPAHLTADQILPFLPKLAEIDHTKDRRPVSVAKILSECANIQAVATYLIDREPWDFMAVYFDAIDHFSHGFMKYHPPRQEWISEKDFELYRNVVNSAYRFHDMMLHGLLSSRSIDENTTIILISDHGFHPDQLRPRHIPAEPTGPAVEHREHGIFVARGPGIRVDELIHGAGVLDIAPTVLTLFGLPVGEDMCGSPLMSIFEGTRTPSTIPSWDDVPGEAGMHPADRHLSEGECREAIAQLVALGYIGKPSEDTNAAVEDCRREADYNLARAYMDAGRFGDAVPLLVRIWEQRPLEHRFGIQLGYCLEMLGHVADQRRVVERILERRRQQSGQAREELRKLTTPKEGAELPLAEKRRIGHLRQLAQFSPYTLHYMLGSVCHAEGKDTEALQHLALAEKADPKDIGLHLLTGKVYLRMKRWKDAEKRYALAVATDPGNAHGHLGLAMTYLPRRMNAKAVVSALAAVEKRYQFPLAHFHLGRALLRTGRVERAVQALQVAATQNPGFRAAHIQLGRIYRRRLNDAAQAEFHERAAAAIQDRAVSPEDLESALAAKTSRAAPPVSPHAASPWKEIKEPITVVSGLPRSGTSMMMRMLAAGGLTPLTDNERPADPDNPHGYFEFEPARRLREDSAWLPIAAGKSVKIVAQLLPSLPQGPRYRIVFMRRDLNEVLASQDAMLARNRRSGGGLPPAKLKAVFGAQVEEVERVLAARHDMETLFLDYRDAVREPAMIAARVNRFMGGGLDEAAMAARVDSGLWRQRSGGEL